MVFSYSIAEVIRERNRYIRIGNVRTRKQIYKVEDLPFGYSIMISHFDNDRIIVRLSVRTPVGLKNVLEIPLNEPMRTRRLEAIKKTLALVEKIVEKHGNEIKPMGQTKQEEAKSLEELI